RRRRPGGRSRSGMPPDASWPAAHIPENDSRFHDDPMGDSAAMIFRQITHDDLGCASYLVGDEDAGAAAVVDPRFEIDDYLDLSRYIGVDIEHVLETHNHADHVSGHGRRAAATGAPIHIHREAGPESEHEPFA